MPWHSRYQARFGLLRGVPALRELIRHLQRLGLEDLVQAVVGSGAAVGSAGEGLGGLKGIHGVEVIGVELVGAFGERG